MFRPTKNELETHLTAIASFESECEESGGTDTGELWALLYLSFDLLNRTLHHFEKESTQ